MAVIIGAGTTIVSAQFPNGGILSVNFGFSPNVQRLFVLGSFQPYDAIVQKTRTLTVNVYGRRQDGSGGSLAHSLTPSVSCADADTVSVTINPASCVSTLLPFTESYFVNSYSYQKDAQGYGQESWGMTTKPIIPTYTGTIIMLRGIAEGTIGTGDGTMAALDMGVVVDETASNDALGAQIEGQSGGVSAGSPGIGNFDISRFVVVTSVGNSLGLDSTIDGKTGNASISVPLTPVFT